MRITLNIKYRKNGELALSPEEMVALYFYGISTRSQDGTLLSMDVYETYIKAAQQEIERYLDILLTPTLITEKIHYHRDDYISGFPIMRVSKPVHRPLSLIGFINGVEQIVYPQSWLSSRTTNDHYFERQIFVVPVIPGVIEGSGEVILSGITAQTGLHTFRNIPNYWTVQYITGSSKISYELMNVIGKLASIGIFNVLGDIVLGQAAVASYSLSIDGLSQSIGTTNSAENSAYSARIKMYMDEVKKTLDRVKSTYRGIGFATL